MLLELYLVRFFECLSHYYANFIHKMLQNTNAAATLLTNSSIPFRSNGPKRLYSERQNVPGECLVACGQ